MNQISGETIEKSLHEITVDVSQYEKLQESVRRFMKLMESEQWTEIYEKFNKLNSYILNSKMMTEANRILRLAKKIKRNYKKFNSDSKKDFVVFVKQHLRKIVSQIKKKIKSIPLLDSRIVIFQLKNYFRHFDDDEDLRMNKYSSLFINLNLKKNESQNKFKIRYKLCTV